jgi:hypothetical protein
VSQIGGLRGVISRDWLDADRAGALTTLDQAVAYFEKQYFPTSEGRTGDLDRVQVVSFQVRVSLLL